MFHIALDFNDKISKVNHHHAGKKKQKTLVNQILLQSVPNANLKGETGNLLGLLNDKIFCKQKICVGKSIPNRSLQLEI